MRSLDELKALLLRHFALVLAVVVLGSTAIIQLPQILRLGALAKELQVQAQQLRIEPERPDPEKLARWERQVPTESIEEPARFLITLNRLAVETGCQLGNSVDSPRQPVEGADGLASIDAAVRLTGRYYQLQRFLTALRAQERTLAVVRADISGATWPELTMDLTIRRYLRTSGLASAAQ